MDGREFLDRVEAHVELEWLGARRGSSPERDEVFIRNTRLNSVQALPISSLLEHSWSDLEAVLTGTRQGRVLSYITRIVGYYSQVQNWNRSKIAELNDRHGGDYRLPESRPIRHTVAPREAVAVA